MHDGGVYEPATVTEMLPDTKFWPAMFSVHGSAQEVGVTEKICKRLQVAVGDVQTPELEHVADVEPLVTM